MVWDYKYLSIYWDLLFYGTSLALSIFLNCGKKLQSSSALDHAWIADLLLLQRLASFPQCIVKGQSSAHAPHCLSIFQRAAAPYQQIMIILMLCLLQELGILSSPDSQNVRGSHTDRQKKMIPCHMDNDTETHSEIYLMLWCPWNIFITLCFCVFYALWLLSSDAWVVTYEVNTALF